MLKLSNRWLQGSAVVLAILATAATVWASSGKAYTVRRGDTLYGIARSHGLSVAELADRNDLSRSYHVYTGQRLVIPVKAKPKVSAPSLPSSVQRAIDRAPVKSGRWKYVVVHHSAVDEGTVEGMDRYHREERHMENGLAYHFVIGNGKGMDDGEIAVGSRWTKQLDGGHLARASQNRVSIGICLVGNFEKHKPSAKQMQRLTALVQALLKRCHLSTKAVKTHQQAHIAHTRCPGKYFPTSTWLNSLQHLHP